MVQFNAITPIKQNPNDKINLVERTLFIFEESVLDQYLGTHPLTAYTPNTITGRHQFKNRLIEVSQQGYSLDLKERFSDIFCIGAPIFDAQSQIAAAIAITVPNIRFYTQFE